MRSMWKTGALGATTLGALALLLLAVVLAVAEPGDARGAGAGILATEASGSRG